MSRNQYNTTRIPSPTDIQAVKMFEEINAPYNAQFSIHIGGIQCGSYKTLDEFKADQAFSKNKFSKQISHITSGFNGIYVEFYRYITKFGTNISESSQWEAEIYFYHNNGQIDPGTAKHISGIIDKYRRTSLENVTPTSGSNELGTAISAELMRMAALQTEIVSQAEAARIKRESELDKRREDLESEIAAARKRDIETLDIERDKIALKDAELEEKRKNLDDRSHMHVRREMREKITETLRERLKTSGVPSNSEGLRQQVFGLCVVASIAFAGIAAFSAVELTQLLKTSLSNPIPFYIVSARLAASSAAAGGTVFYLLAWFKRLHDTDLKAHRDLERYLYDVDRASWVVETMLESQRKGENELPAEIPHDWVLGVTHGLFARTEPRDESQVTMEALGSLLNFAAEAELGPQGPRIKLTKAGIKRLSRSGSLDTGSE